MLVNFLQDTKSGKPPAKALPLKSLTKDSAFYKWFYYVSFLLYSSTCCLWQEEVEKVHIMDYKATGASALRISRGRQLLNCIWPAL